MSDLSIRTAPDVAVNPPRKAAVDAKSSDVNAQASSQKASVDVSNYVTSPKGVVDPQSGVYVLQYRDGATGEVLNQYPSEKVVDAYKRGASNGEAKPAPVETTASGTVSSSVTGGLGNGGVSGTVSGSTGAEVSAPSAPAPAVGSSGATSSVGKGSTPSAGTSIEA
ncbi:hypothetical protein [Magnetovibrio blakemorei]|uniref:hypothetical protein n=1 Tax=Magnetovibrio blakemorei TaxID=28181 RepID=UPI001112EDB7|nr:hypothetical protein [Magnetovibrio blakemorei]